MKPPGLYLRWQLLLHFLRMGRRALSLRKPRLIGKWIREDRHSIIARKLFSLGDFQGARAHALSHLVLRSEDAQIRIVVLCCAIEMQDYETAERHFALLDKSRVSTMMQRQLPLYRYAIVKAGEEGLATKALGELDGLFAEMGCRTVRAQSAIGEEVFDSFSTPIPVKPAHAVNHYPLTEGPLVSVVMTTFNTERVVSTAIKSILNQNYCNIELIVVDDCSTDETVMLLCELAHRDTRIRIIAKASNDGTYVSKNLGIKVARGKYIALQDSDDWSHPDRIGKSVGVLEARPEVVALTTEWIRMTSAANLIIQSTTRCAYRSCISLVFRRERVVARAGYFDSVRAEGDAEYIERLSAIFGDDAVVEMPWLLAFGRVRAGAVSVHPQFGMMRGRAMPDRAAYRKAYKRWHERIGREGPGYIDFPLNKRPFPAPRSMLAAKTRGYIVHRGEKPSEEPEHTAWQIEASRSARKMGSTDHRES